METTTLVPGTVFEALFPVGDKKAWVEARIVKEHFGENSVAYSFVVLDTDGDAFEVGGVYHWLGRDLYRRVTEIVSLPDNISWVLESRTPEQIRAFRLECSHAYYNIYLQNGYDAEVARQLAYLDLEMYYIDQGYDAETAHLLAYAHLEM